LIYDPVQGTYSTRQGPIFANLVLADEINRAPSKVQSALLEAMQERQVTIGDKTWPLPEPFLVLATQNPIEQEGTYPLPEAQMDRFMLKVVVGYPTAEEELIILDRMASTRPQLTIDSVVKPEEISAYQTLVNTIHVDPLVRDYIVRLVVATREAAAGSGVAPELKRLVRIGASPRATINLTLAARACALIEGRNHVTPDDVKRIAPDVFRHRILLTYEAEAEEVTTESIVRTLLAKVKVP
jgi:MoxR-like ATPase